MRTPGRSHVALLSLLTCAALLAAGCERDPVVRERKELMKNIEKELKRPGTGIAAYFCAKLARSPGGLPESYRPRCTDAAIVDMRERMKAMGDAFWGHADEYLGDAHAIGASGPAFTRLELDVRLEIVKGSARNAIWSGQRRERDEAAKFAGTCKAALAVAERLDPNDPRLAEARDGCAAATKAIDDPPPGQPPDPFAAFDRMNQRSRDRDCGDALHEGHPKFDACVEKHCHNDGDLSAWQACLDGCARGVGPTFSVCYQALARSGEGG